MLLCRQQNNAQLGVQSISAKQICLEFYLLGSPGHDKTLLRREHIRCLQVFLHALTRMAHHLLEVLRKEGGTLLPSGRLDEFEVGVVLGELVDRRILVGNGHTILLGEELSDLIVRNGSRAGDGVASTVVLLGLEHDADSHLGDVVGRDVVHTLSIRGAEEFMLFTEQLALETERITGKMTGEQDRVVQSWAVEQHFVHGTHILD